MILNNDDDNAVGAEALKPLQSPQKEKTDIPDKCLPIPCPEDDDDDFESSQDKCVICGKDLTYLPTIRERLIHVNKCIDAQNSSANLCCSICGKDITKYSIKKRLRHANNCLDKQARKKKNKAPKKTSSAAAGSSKAAETSRADVLRKRLLEVDAAMERLQRKREKICELLSQARAKEKHRLLLGTSAIDVDAVAKAMWEKTPTPKSPRKSGSVKSALWRAAQASPSSILKAEVLDFGSLYPVNSSVDVRALLCKWEAEAPSCVNLVFPNWIENLHHLAKHRKCKDALEEARNALLEKRNRALLKSCAQKPSLPDLPRSVPRTPRGVDSEDAASAYAFFENVIDELIQRCHNNNNNNNDDDDESSSVAKKKQSGVGVTSTSPATD